MSGSAVWDDWGNPMNDEAAATEAVKNWCGVEWCSGHPNPEERHLIDMTTGRYDCCGTDALRADSFHAAGCPNACAVLAPTEQKQPCCTSAAEHRAHGGTPQSRLIGGIP